MSLNWMISTNNDPLGVIRSLLNTVWEQNHIEKALLLTNGNAKIAEPSIIRSSKQINFFNPFTPVMSVNSASLIPTLVENQKPVFAVLRPCEFRSLQEMIRLKRVETDNLLTICIDCLGTLPLDEYEWRVKRKKTPKEFTQESIRFARQGGIVPYRYRSACQICTSPAITNADINVHILGLPVRQYLLLQFNNEEIATSLEQLEHYPATTELTLQHQRVVSRVESRGFETRNRIYASLVEYLPENIDQFIEQLNRCGDCRSCMDVCPSCSAVFPRKTHHQGYEREEILEWLISCSECGLCEQSCPDKLPLSIIFSHIRSQLAEANSLQH
jgi:formate dehydrogenase subunit beta